MDLGAIVVEGAWSAGPLLAVHYIIEYLIRLQLRYFNRPDLTADFEGPVIEGVDEDLAVGQTLTTQEFIAYRDMVSRYVRNLAPNEGVNERLLLGELNRIVIERLSSNLPSRSMQGETQLQILQDRLYKPQQHRESQLAFKL